VALPFRLHALALLLFRHPVLALLQQLRPLLQLLRLDLGTILCISLGP
jgi:hypothetical protein